MPKNNYPEYSAAPEVDLSEPMTEIVWNDREKVFPAVSVSCRNRFYFNKASEPLIAQRLFRIGVTSEYIVFMPAAESGHKAFKITDQRSLRIPTDLRNMSPKDGVYRLYKYKDGFCFKRYEPIGKEESRNDS